MEKDLSFWARSKLEFTKLFVFFRTPMKLSFIIFYQIFLTLQFLTIPAAVDGTLPLDYERLAPMWNLINYACRPDTWSIVFFG
jgi:hypothetical protein